MEQIEAANWMYFAHSIRGTFALCVCVCVFIYVEKKSDSATFGYWNAQYTHSPIKSIVEWYQQRFEWNDIEMGIHVNKAKMYRR